ncbi:hypothetical protein G6F46_014560 [Rhizopus delemar]|nr:hypothetical protein G6F46_014560 [Rhizopus delemar]
MLREAIEHRLELPVVIASTLAEADRLLSEDGGWFLVLTGLVLADGDRDAVVEFFLKRGLPTVVVSSVYDEDLRKRHRLPGLAGAAAGAQPSHRGAGGGRFALRARLCRRPAAHVRP